MHYAQHGMAQLFEKSPLSPQGYDEAFATNFFGHALLTELLLPLLQKQPSSRVISTSSHQTDGHELLPPNIHTLPKAADGSKQDFDHRYYAYAITKLAEIVYTQQLQRRLNQHLHPTTSTLTSTETYSTLQE